MRQKAILCSVINFYLVPSHLGLSLFIMLYYLNFRDWECCCCHPGICLCQWVGFFAEGPYWVMLAFQITAFVLLLFLKDQSVWLLVAMPVGALAMAGLILCWRQYRMFRLGHHRWKTAAMRRRSDPQFFKGFYTTEWERGEYNKQARNARQARLNENVATVWGNEKSAMISRKF